MVDVYGIGNNVDVCDGKWHNIVATYDVSTKTFLAYIDGFCYNKSTSFYPNPTLDIGEHDNYLSIGGRYADFPITGLMDDVRFYNRALTAAEVDAIYGMVDPAVAVADAFASGSADGGYYTKTAAYAPAAGDSTGELVFTAAFDTAYLSANAKHIKKAGLMIYASENRSNEEKWKKGEAEVSALLENDGNLTVTVTDINFDNFADNVVAVPYILLSNGTVLSATGDGVTTKCVNDFSANWLGMADN